MDNIGQASGSQSTVRQIGSALGIAVLGTTLFTSTQLATAENISSLSAFQGVPAAQVEIASQNIADSVVESAGAIIPVLDDIYMAQGMPENLATDFKMAAENGFTEGVKTTGWVAAAFLAVGLVSTFNLSSRRKTPAKKK
jgi:hypothetical protein